MISMKKAEKLNGLLNLSFAINSLNISEKKSTNSLLIKSILLSPKKNNLKTLEFENIIM